MPWRSFQEGENAGRFQERSGIIGYIFYKDHSGCYVEREPRGGMSGSRKANWEALAIIQEKDRIGIRKCRGLQQAWT